METFHYFPPGTEEQRSFLFQLLATVISFVVIGVLWWRSGDGGARAMLVGAGLVVLWMLGRTAWLLERKAQRSQNAEVGMDDAGLHITDPSGRSRDVPWESITDVRVVGGRLMVQWADGSLVVGAREIENGMELVRKVVKRHESGAFEQPRAFTSFIPLEPK
jgi:hypothetical protein